MKRWAGSILVLLLVSAACSKAPVDRKASGGSDKGAGEPIVIGGVFGLSGLMEPFDGPPYKGAQIAVQQINESGGVLGRELKLEVIDMKSEPPEAADAAIELIDRGAVAIIAPCDFDMGSPAGVEANDAGVPVISSCAASPLFGLEGIGPFAFTMSPGTHNASAVMAEWAYQEKGWRTAYILADQYNEYTISLQRYFKQRWTELAGEGSIVGEDTFKFGDEDLSSQISRIASLDPQPDFIWLPSFVPQTGTVAKELRAAGIDVPLLGADAFDSKLLVDVGGKDLSDVYYAAHGFIWDKGESAATDAFIDDFTAEFGVAPENAYTLMGFDTVSAIARAIENADSTDGEAIQAALEAFDGVEFLSGATTFTPESHQPVRKPMAIIEVQGGEYGLVEWWTPEQVPAPQI